MSSPIIRCRTAVAFDTACIPCRWQTFLMAAGFAAIGPMPPLSQKDSVG